MTDFGQAEPWLARSPRTLDMLADFGRRGDQTKGVWCEGVFWQGQFGALER